MTNPKIVPSSISSDGVPRVEHPELLAKTRELPALDGEPDGKDAEGVPCEITDGEVTVPMRSSIESTLTFEVLRRQSVDGDDDDGTP
jgi:hypothetical protein